MDSTWGGDDGGYEAGSDGSIVRPHICVPLAPLRCMYARRGSTTGISISIFYLPRGVANILVRAYVRGVEVRV